MNSLFKETTLRLFCWFGFHRWSDYVMAFEGYITDYDKKVVGLYHRRKRKCEVCECESSLTTTTKYRPHE